MSVKYEEMNYLLEALVVGLATMILGTIISVVAMYSQADFSISKITFWPSLLASHFLVGFLVHLVCEWSGVNRWYCKNGHACTTK